MSDTMLTKRQHIHSFNSPVWKLSGERMFLKQVLKLRKIRKNELIGHVKLSPGPESSHLCPVFIVRWCNADRHKYNCREVERFKCACIEFHKFETNSQQNSTSCLKLHSTVTNQVSIYTRKRADTVRGRGCKNDWFYMVNEPAVRVLWESPSLHTVKLMSSCEIAPTIWDPSITCQLQINHDSLAHIIEECGRENQISKEWFYRFLTELWPWHWDNILFATYLFLR